MGRRKNNRGESSGEGEVWEGVIDKYGPFLNYLARKGLNPRLWRKVAPSDMVQNTLLEAHRERANLKDSSEAELLSWLRSNLRYRIIDEVRKLKCKKNNVDLEIAITQTLVIHSPSPSGIAQKNEEVLRLMAVLERLPKSQRDAVALLHLEGQELGEIAKQMGKSKNAVSSLVCRGIERLCELMKRVG